MANGTFKFTHQFRVDVGLKKHNLATDTFKLALITSATTPTEATSDPRWGAGGSTNWSTNQCTPGGNYTSGGITLTNKTYANNDGVAEWKADQVDIDAHASNPTNAAWVILYNSTSSGKEVVGYGEIDPDADLSGGPFSWQWNELAGNQLISDSA